VCARERILKISQYVLQFLPRDARNAKRGRPIAIASRPSVRPSVRLSGFLVIFTRNQRKTFAKILQKCFGGGYV